MDMLVVHAAQIVTPEHSPQPLRGVDQGKVRVIEDGALLVRDGRILAVGPTAQVQALPDAQGVPSLNARGHVVLPGLVDVHTHPLYAGTRADEYEQRLRGLSSQDIRDLGGGMPRTVERVRALDEEALTALAAAHSRRMAAAGTLLIEMKTGYGLTLASELRMLAALGRLGSDEPDASIVPCFLGAHFVPPDFQGDANAFADLVVREMLPAVHAQGIAELCDVGCDPGFFSLEQTDRILRAAMALGLRGRLHADSVADAGAWELAVRLGIAGADHLNATSDAAIRRAGASTTAAVLLPAAELFYREPTRANARLFIDTGVPVVVASDHSSSIEVSDLAAVLSLACVWYGLTPAEVLVATTLNAAFVLGRASNHGSLSEGKWADFWLAQGHDYRHVFQRFGYPLARRVFRHGCEIPFHGTDDGRE